jgi:hypothetical protein
LFGFADGSVSLQRDAAVLGIALESAGEASNNTLNTVTSDTLLPAVQKLCTDALGLDQTQGDLIGLLDVYLTQNRFHQHEHDALLAARQALVDWGDGSTQLKAELSKVSSCIGGSGGSGR